MLKDMLVDESRGLIVVNKLTEITIKLRDGTPVYLTFGQIFQVPLI
jgi:hypothetical protein